MTNVTVTGKIAYSRIASLLDGDDLRDQIKRDLSNGSSYPNERPRTTMTIIDPKIVVADSSQALTPEQSFVKSKFFTSKKHNDTRYTAENNQFRDKKTHEWIAGIPTIFQLNAAGQASQINADGKTLPGEPVQGTEVTLVVKVNPNKRHNPNDSKSKPFYQVMDTVLLPANVKYYGTGIGSNGASSANALAALGITVDESTLGDPTVAPAPAADATPAFNAGTAPAADLSATAAAYAQAVQAAPAPVAPDAPVQPAPVQPAPVQQVAPQAPVQATPVAPAQPAVPAQPPVAQQAPVQATPAPVAPQAAPVQQAPVQATPAAGVPAGAPADAATSPFEVDPATVTPSPTDPWGASFDPTAPAPTPGIAPDNDDY